MARILHVPFGQGLKMGVVPRFMPIRHEENIADELRVRARSELEESAMLMMAAKAGIDPIG